MIKKKKSHNIYLKEINERLDFLLNVGLDYLNIFQENQEPYQVENLKE